MFCPKCGSSIPEGSRFCPNCGFNIAGGFDASAPIITPFDKAKKTLTDPLFLAIAIILSVAAGAKLLAAGPDILLILIVVGVWMAYAGATGENTGLIGNGISLASVSVKIQYVLTYVAAGLMFFSGLILFVCFINIGDSFGEFAAEFYAAFEESAHEMGLSLDDISEILTAVEQIFSVLANLSGMMIGLLFMALCTVTGGVMILCNILFTGRFSKFLSAASLNAKAGKEVSLYDRTFAVWLLVYGIIMSVETVSTFAANQSIIALICNGCLAAACIMASVMMKKEA